MSGSTADQTADLWLRIDQLHLNYLKSENNTKKLEIRKKLEGKTLKNEHTIVASAKQREQGGCEEVGNGKQELKLLLRMNYYNCSLGSFQVIVLRYLIRVCQLNFEICFICRVHKSIFMSGSARPKVL